MDVLRALFGPLIIPPAVVDGLSRKAGFFPHAAQAPSSADVTVRAPADHLLVKGLTGRIHRGEAECLVLAMENPGALGLLDDLAAREIATTHEILFTGTLGCLSEAKRRGLIAFIEPLLRDLRINARFWISDQLAERVLRSVGE